MRLLRHFMCCVIALLPAAAAHAQIRPVEPVIWRAFDGDANILASAGLGYLFDQPVDLTGTTGRYEELGRYSITWVTGRVALSASGVAYLRLTEEQRFAPARDGVGTEHHDAGPVVVEAAARLTPATSPVLAVVRFGTRLPVTSKASGLDRDRTDFFATMGARTSHAALWAAGEAGVGINGRPYPADGQKDVLTYSVGTGYDHDLGTADVWLVGRDDLHSYRIPSHEDLLELRVGVRTAGRFWIGAQWIHGLTEWSPANGVRIAAGVDALFERVPVLGWD